MEPLICLSGVGYDVHPFAEGRPLVLGGVTIPHDRGLAGHSDADVLVHAIADAILGAIGESDIGYHFPPGLEETRDIDSLLILAKAVDLMAAQGGRLVNIDAMLIAEEPKVGPHAAQMRERLAEATGLPPRRVGIKATTNEKMGFVGRSEGIAALATCSVAMPASILESENGT